MLDPQDLSRALKELRGKRTQREVARKAGLDPATWSSYERGSRYPRGSERFQQLAKGLGVTDLELQNAILESANRRMADATIGVISRKVLAEPLALDSVLLPGGGESAELRRFIDERLAGASREIGELFSLFFRVLLEPVFRGLRSEG